MSSVLNSTRFSSKLSNVSTPFSVTRPKPSLRSLRKRSINVHCVSFPIRTRLESCRCSSSDVSETVHPVQIKRMESDQELIQFLQMVLQGYFESSFGSMFQDDHSGYVNSFMKQKLETEVDRLRQRFQSNGNKTPEAICLIAVQENSEVAGGCEICVSERLSGICPVGVPVAEKDGFYIQNLIVQPEQRRKGIGDLMMQSTLEMVKEMGGSVIYAHMEAQNDPALGLYKKYGFEVVKEMQQMDPAASPGMLLLLKLELEKNDAAKKPTFVRKD